jgi:hypothetical protein
MQYEHADRAQLTNPGMMIFMVAKTAERSTAQSLVFGLFSNAQLEHAVRWLRN